MTTRLIVSVEPTVAAVVCRARRTDEDHAAWRNQPLKHRANQAAIHPVQRPTNRNDVERANVGR